MTHILKDKELEVHIDPPEENYNFSRFDWTGKIVDVTFREISLAAMERMDGGNPLHLGRGFYNEFGIGTALGFEVARVGGWFHKIGVGLLKKTEGPYLFHKSYEIIPAKFTFRADTKTAIITCHSDSVNGYSYMLQKEISADDKGFTINYALENTGTQRIRTDEYVHNFMAVDREDMGTDYRLQFPFDLKPGSFGETVNPGHKVEIGPRRIRFNGKPEEQFFFSNLSGGDRVRAGWELIHARTNLGISESGNFQTDQVNLWGWKHVISPELFVKLELEPGQSARWERKYRVYNLAER
jgi:hypothetical protein